MIYYPVKYYLRVVSTITVCTPATLQGTKSVEQHLNCSSYEYETKYEVNTHADASSEQVS